MQSHRLRSSAKSKCASPTRSASLPSLQIGHMRSSWGQRLGSLAGPAPRWWLREVTGQKSMGKGYFEVFTGIVSIHEEPRGTRKTKPGPGPRPPCSRPARAGVGRAARLGRRPPSFSDPGFGPLHSLFTLHPPPSSTLHPPSANSNLPSYILHLSNYFPLCPPSVPSQSPLSPLSVPSSRGAKGFVPGSRSAQGNLPSTPPRESHRKGFDDQI